MEGMNGIQEAIPYEEVAAYQANQGVSMYAMPSGGTETGGFMVSWDSDAGFTGGGWDFDNPSSPACGKTEEEIQEEITTNGDLNELFENWSENVPFPNRLNWVTSWMNGHPSCVYEA